MSHLGDPGPASGPASSSGMLSEEAFAVSLGLPPCFEKTWVESFAASEAFVAALEEALVLVEEPEIK